MEAEAAEDAVVYLDNNATTLMSQKTIDAMIRWMNRGNPSAEYASAREARAMMDAFRERVARDGKFPLEGADAFAVVFTSGGSESNCHITTSAVRSYAARTGKLPHLIISAAEHKSLLNCATQFEEQTMAQLTVLPVMREGPGAGAVDPRDLEAAIRPNTCLVSIMAANNETGALNDIRALGQICHRRRIPFHTDAVQLFGKSAVRPAVLGIDAFSASFHKLHGPPGVGLLVVRRTLIVGYGLCAHICGSQNGGLRGGTENTPAIAGAYAAYRAMAQDRAPRNAKMRALRDGIKKALASRYRCVHLDGYARAAGEDRGGKKGRALIVWLGPADPRLVLPNTLLLAVRRRAAEGRAFCNRAARAALERRGVIVSVGSACNSADPGASHVVKALGVPPELWPGVLRVSLSDDTTEADTAAFVARFGEALEAGECDGEPGA